MERAAVDELATAVEVGNRLLHADYLILDTRSTSEYEGCRVIGSISCPPPTSFVADFNKASFSLSDVGLCLSANDHKHFMGEHREGQKILIGINGSPSSGRTDPWALRLFELFSVRAAKAAAARAAAKERKRMLSRAASSSANNLARHDTRLASASGSGGSAGSVGPSTPPRGKYLSPMKVATLSTSPARRSQGSLSDLSPRGSASVGSHSSLFETASDGMLASRSGSSDEMVGAEFKSGPAPWPLRMQQGTDTADNDIAYGRAWCVDGYDPPAVRFLSLPLLFEKAPMLWCPAGLLVTSKQFFAQPSCILDGFLYLSDQCAAADPRVCGPQGTLRPSHIVNVTNRKATNYFEESPAPGRAADPAAISPRSAGGPRRNQQLGSPAGDTQPRALDGAFRAEQAGTHRQPLAQPPSAEKRPLTAQNIMDSILASASASAGTTPREKPPAAAAAAAATAAQAFRSPPTRVPPGTQTQPSSPLPPPPPAPLMSTPPRRPSASRVAASVGSRSPVGHRNAGAAMGSPSLTPTRSPRMPTGTRTQQGSGLGATPADDGPPLLTLDYWDQQEEEENEAADGASVDAAHRGRGKRSPGRGGGCGGGGGGVAYLNVALWDSVHADITPHLETAYEFIEECRRHNQRIAEEEALEAAAVAALLNADAPAANGVAPKNGEVTSTADAPHGSTSWLSFPSTLAGLTFSSSVGETPASTAAANDDVAETKDELRAGGSDKTGRTDTGGGMMTLQMPRSMLAASDAASYLQRRRTARQPRRVLVHCAMGISRSPALLIYYVMKSQRLSLREAYNYVKFCRPETFPNRAFMLQLIDAERRLYPELAANGWETSITVNDLGKIGGLLSEYQSKTETSVGLVATGSDRGQHAVGTDSNAVGARRDGMLSSLARLTAVPSVALLCEGSGSKNLRSPTRNSSCVIF